MAVCVLNRLHTYLLGFDVKHDIKPVFWIKGVEYQGYFSTYKAQDLITGRFNMQIACVWQKSFNWL